MSRVSICLTPVLMSLLGVYKTKEEEVVVAAVVTSLQQQVLR